MEKILLIVLLALPKFHPSMAQDLHQELKVRFVHELASNGRFQWKSITVLFSESAMHDKGDWISDINIPKVIFQLVPGDNLNIKKMPPTDAYLVITDADSNDMMEDCIMKLAASKQLDSTKTFIIFSHNTVTLHETTDLDVILVEQKYGWNPETQATDKPILVFLRYRSLSILEPLKMTGIYHGATLSAGQKKILFDGSFNYGNRQVKVTTFPLPPTTIECKQDKEQFCGRDPNLIRVIGEILHFQPIFSRPALTDSKWGDRLDNGTWTGLIGEVSVGETTLGVANVFTTLHYIEQVDVSYPYDISCSTFLTPSPNVWPQFYTLVKPFDVSLWMATIFSLFVGGILIQMVALLYNRLFGLRDRLQFFGEAMLYNAQSITGVRSGSEENSAWPIRLYNSNWWLFCFLIGTIYRTGLTSWLASSPILMLPIDTIAQLVRSDLKPYGFNTFVRDLAQYSTDPDTIQLGRRLELVPPNVTVEFLMGQQDSNAVFENKNYLKYLSVTILPSAMHNKSVKNVDPRQRLHVMHECLRTFPVAIAMTPGTPFKSAITQIIHQLNAAGMIQHWLDSVVYNDNSLTKRSKKGQRQEPFTLYCLEGAFYLLLLCYSIDIVVFIAEVAFHHIYCRRPYL